MARCSPRFVSVFASSTFLLVGFTRLLTVAAASAENVRITTVSNLTMRATPAADAPVVAFVPLGTEVREANPAGLDKTWLLVRLGDGREGWVQAKFTRAIDPAWPWPVYDEVMAERLGRKGDGFTSLIELVSFVERVRPTYNDPESRARLELMRLRALSRAAAAIPFNASKREPYAAWLASRTADVMYDEPGGRWMVAAPVVWDVHARHERSAAADEIAWFAVTIGLPGECEGNVYCYFAAADALHGTYLRAHPSGRHAAESVETIAGLMNNVLADGRVRTPYQFDAKDDCAELRKAVEGLLTALNRTNTGKGRELIERLGTVRSLCR